MRVAVGRLTFSTCASSEGVSGPRASTVASAAVSAAVSSVPEFWRSRRAVRAMASRSLEAVSSVLSILIQSAYHC